MYCSLQWRKEEWKRPLLLGNGSGCGCLAKLHCELARLCARQYLDMYVCVSADTSVSVSLPVCESLYVCMKGQVCVPVCVCIHLPLTLCVHVLILSV